MVWSVLLQRQLLNCTGLLTLICWQLSLGICQPYHYRHLGLGKSLLWGCPVHCRVFGSTPTDVTPKNILTLPCPLGANCPSVSSTSLDCVGQYVLEIGLL